MKTSGLFTLGLICLISSPTFATDLAADNAANAANADNAAPAIVASAPTVPPVPMDTPPSSAPSPAPAAASASMPTPATRIPTPADSAPAASVASDIAPETATQSATNSATGNGAIAPMRQQKRMAKRHAAGLAQGARPTDMQQKRLQLIQPMPSLMRVIMQHADSLEIDPKQAAAFRAWRHTNHPKVFQRMDAIQKLRKELQQEVLKGANLARVNSYLWRMDQLRAEIVAAKLACRNMVRRVLSGEQWQKLVEIYEAEYL